MKTKKRYFALPILLGIALTSCSNAGVGDFDNVSNNISDFRCWSTYGTTKVLQNNRDTKSYYSLGESINVNMMQKEVEGSQLIITPSGNESGYVTLDVNDLRSSNGETLSKDKIHIYFQKYIKITSLSNQNPNYKMNDMVPDMLLPLETAIKFKENVVKGGENQGLTIEFDSTDVAPGTYQGTFLLHVGKLTKNISVNVEVWPISLNHKSQFQSSFLLYRNELLVGEYDNSDEMIASYIDEMLDYRINPYVIQNIENNTVENLVNTAQKYFDNPNYNSIIIPYDFATGYKAQDGARAINYIQALAKISTPEKPYLDYAYFYPGGFDEADLDIYYKSAASEGFFKPGGELDQTLEAAIISLNDYFATISPEWAEHLKNSIRNIPTVFTNVDFKDEWVGSYHATFCPYTSLFQDTRVTQRYQDAAKKMSNGDLWAYTCSGPVAPWATFHIDDDNINMRVNGWIGKKIGLTGYLYYEVNKNTKVAGGSNNEDVLVDLYNDPLRYESINGDGYLFYPGRKYELKKPIATNRLAAYRDSMEDIDMLTVLEEKLQSLSSFYATNEIKLENYVGDLYDAMFNGSTPTTSEENFYQLRNELAKRILDLDNEENLLIYQSYENGKCYDNVFTKNNFLLIDGDNVSSQLVRSGEGYLYKVLAGRDNSTHLLTTGNTTFNRKFNGALCLGNFSTTIDNVIASGETIKTVKKGDNKITATIISEQRNRFQPYIGISSDQISNYDELYLEYTNLDDTDIDNLTINLYRSGYGNMFICTNTCPAHETRTLRLNLKAVGNYELSIANEIRLIFENEYMDKNGQMHLLNDRHISISNIYVKKA